MPQDPAQVVPLAVGATIPTGPSALPMAPTGVGFQPDPQRHTDGYYTNEVANEPQRQVDENYQGNIGRLVEVTNKYDPDNLFRLNANVKPTA